MRVARRCVCACTKHSFESLKQDILNSFIAILRWFRIRKLSQRECHQYKRQFLDSSGLFISRGIGPRSFNKITFKWPEKSKHSRITLLNHDSTERLENLIKKELPVVAYRWALQQKRSSIFQNMFFQPTRLQFSSLQLHNFKSHKTSTKRFSYNDQQHPFFFCTWSSAVLPIYTCFVFWCASLRSDFSQKLFTESERKKRMELHGFSEELNEKRLDWRRRRLKVTKHRWWGLCGILTGCWKELSRKKSKLTSLLSPARMPSLDLILKMQSDSDISLSDVSESFSH